MAERDDEDWLLARERGEDVSDVPARTRARYEQLDNLIAALPEHAPPPGWKQRVLAALDALAPHSSSDALATPRTQASSASVESLTQAPSPAVGSSQDSPPAQTSSPAVGSSQDSPPAQTSSPAVGSPPAETGSSARRPPIVHGRRAWALAGAAAAAGILVLLLIRNSGTTPPLSEAVVTTEIRRGERPHRGSDVAVGDTLVVHAQADRPIELRVYDEGGEPLARCTDTQGCTVERSGAERRYSLELVLRSPGAVRAVLFTGAGAIPEPLNDLDADLEAAHAAHVETRQVAIVHVQ